MSNPFAALEKLKETKVKISENPKKSKKQTEKKDEAVVPENKATGGTKKPVAKVTAKPLPAGVNPLKHAAEQARLKEEAEKKEADKKKPAKKEEPKKENGAAEPEKENGATEEKAEEPVPEVPKLTVAEFEKERESKKFVVQQREQRKVDTKAYAKMQELKQEDDEIKIKFAKAEKPKPKSAKGGKAVPQPKPAAEKKPKAETVNFVDLQREYGEDGSGGGFRGRGGRGRGRGGRGGYTSEPNIQDTAAFPSLAD